MTNFNYLVNDGDDRYVVRLGEDDPVHLISRRNEVASSQAAYEIGLSPELIHHESGALVIRFIDGKVFEESDVQNPANLSRIIDAIQTLHRGVPDHFHELPQMFWVFQILRHYRYLLQDSQSRHKTRLVELEKIANEMRSELKWRG